MDKIHSINPGEIFLTLRNEFKRYDRLFLLEIVKGIYEIFLVSKDV